MKEPGAEQSEQLVEQLIQWIGRWHLTLPSLLFLEVTKPFSFVASQGLLLCQPFLSFFDIERQIADYASLLADRSNIDRLITRLEQQMETHNTNGGGEN